MSEAFAIGHYWASRYKAFPRTMDERTLLRASLLASIMGLLALFLASSFGSIDLIEIEKVDGTHPSAVKVYGSVESIRSAGEGQVIVVSQPSSIEVFVSKPTTLQRGDIVEIIGRSEEYLGESQIIAERIRASRGAMNDP